MKALPARNLLIGFVMIVAAIIGLTINADSLVVNHGPKVDLETMIPKQFGDWHLDGAIIPVSASPEQEEMLQKIYSQILTRTYVSSQGNRVMLSVVYGDGIDKQLDVHRPEICYAAQGFSMSENTDLIIHTLFGGLPVRRLVATNGPRIEPISYWIKVGDKAVSSAFERKMTKLKQVLTGRADSGMLARVSSIETNQVLAFKEQEAFINAMLSAMPPDQRKLLIGDQLVELTIAKDMK
jgi:EpsI family protein